LTYVRTQLRPGGQFQFKDPAVYFLERGENGDRAKQTTTLSAYIGDAVKNQELIAPTLTTYIHPKKVQSLLVDFIDGNVKKRGVAKKAQFKAKMAGDKLLEALKKGEQTTYKLGNNSISGAHVSASTPLFNRTAHSTLTSNCRSTSGYGNANNEKFLCGNRHYWHPDIVRNNIISIINHTDYAKLRGAMEQYGIRCPTVDEAMECVTYSTQLYWKGDDQLERIYALLCTLTDIERAAFVYTGDLYHLMKYNDGVVRQFITKLSSKVVADVQGQCANADQIIENSREDDRHLCSQICSTEVKGKKNGVKDLIGTVDYDTYALTLQNIGNTLKEYEPLIKAFWVTPNLPASVAVFPDSIRRAAVTSDTDSTIFTVQDWVQWHQGRICFTPEAMGVAATMIYLASQTITHVLARMSANFGIEEKRLHQIAMKNEFYFPVFVPTQVAKHYYAKIGVQEGNVFGELDMEIKGVHLKSSNAPREIMEEAKKMMDFIMLEVMAERPISINHILKWIADIDRGVMASIKKGGYEYFRKNQIKTPSSYIDGEQSSNYQQYKLWRDVFASKYGEINEPPYTAVKISADLSSPAKTKEWLSKFTDQELAKRVEDWMARNNKKHMGTSILLPEPCIQLVGIPEEVLAAVDVRKLVLETTKVFYLILETLGVYMLNGKITRLASDTH
jgi:hypothetical protein